MCHNWIGIIWHGLCQKYFQVSGLLCSSSLFLVPPSKANDTNSFSAANWFKCGLETLLLGGACATVAYIIGQFVDKHVVSG